jgi:pimeloyl-ACP methyl ester carboxylesterase
MKRHGVLLFVGVAGLALTGFGQAQIARSSRFRFPQRQLHRLGGQTSTPLRAQQSFLPVAATPDVILVQCPAEAIGLDPAVTCGYLPVPMHRERPETTETIKIYFEVYPHTNAGQAESAILVNGGGPGSTTTGFRAFWLSMFAPNLDMHDLLLVDDRGRGFSGAIDCEPGQHGLGPTWDDEVADCASQLGDENSAYGSGDIAQDVDAVRAALEYDLVDYYGASYGGVDVTAYATRFPEHLRSVVLDSPVGTPDLQPFHWQHDFVSSATSREIRLDCQRSPTCARDHPNPDAEFAQLIEDVKNHAVRGYANDAYGNLVHVDFDEVGLLSLVGNQGGQAGALVEAGELLAAADSLRRGDDLPLLRLGAEAIQSWMIDYGDPTFFSIGAAGATDCVDTQMPYDWSLPPQKRFQQLTEAVSDLPRDYFSLFSKVAGARLDRNGVSNSIPRVCLFWEQSSTPAPVVPPGAAYPSVPTLVFSGEVDASVPDEETSKVAALFPSSTFLIVPEGLHVPAQASQCALNLITNLIETLQVGDTICLETPEVIFAALGRFPLAAEDARPAEINPHGHNEISIPERKVVTVALATAIDALKRSTIGSGNGVGLRAGTFQTSIDANGNQTTTLTDCAFAKDVTVNGTVVWGADKSFVADLTVSGTGTAGGTLHVEGTWEAPGSVGKFKVSGALGGRQVATVVPEA